jgi:hypothetical protein
MHQPDPGDGGHQGGFAPLHGGLQPSLTATVSRISGQSGRDGETALSRTKKLVKRRQGCFYPHRIARRRKFYADLKIYRTNPSKTRRLTLRARFDRIFRRRTGFVTLDRLLARLWANKAELLMALERPEIPLHTNGSENDIRCQVTRRKVSAGTRSDAGRDCRDAFLGLAKTCAKQGVAFWDYLGSRLNVAGQLVVPPLPELVRCRGQPV